MSVVWAEVWKESEPSCAGLQGYGVERAEIESIDNSGSLRGEDEERIDKGRWILGLEGVDTEEKWEARRKWAGRMIRLLSRGRIGTALESIKRVVPEEETSED